MPPLIVNILIGSAIGAIFGYAGRCTGACALTSTWRRGALFGAAAGLLVWLVASPGDAAALGKPSQNVQAITADQFDGTVLQSSSPVVVDFYATWCVPCRKLSPMLDSIADEFTNRIRFVKIDIDHAPALTERLEIQGVPTLLFYKDGKIAGRTLGVPTAAELRSRLDSLAGSPAK